MKNLIFTVIAICFIVSFTGVAWSQSQADLQTQKVNELVMAKKYLEAAHMMEKSIHYNNNATNLGLSRLADKLDSIGYYYEIAGHIEEATNFYEKAINVRNRIN